MIMALFPVIALLSLAFGLWIFKTLEYADVGRVICQNPVPLMSVTIEPGLLPCDGKDCGAAEMQAVLRSQYHTLALESCPDPPHPRHNPFSQ